MNELTHYEKYTPESTFLKHTRERHEGRIELEYREILSIRSFLEVALHPKNRSEKF